MESLRFRLDTKNVFRKKHNGQFFLILDVIVKKLVIESGLDMMDQGLLGC